MDTLLEQILNTDTQNPPGNERPLAEQIAGYLSGTPCAVTVQPVGNNRANVIAVLKGGRPGNALLLNGHLDTVPYGGAGWNTPPGVAVEKNGYIYARGACDMKSGLAAMLRAFREYADSGVSPRRSVIFAATADEESGGLGAEALCKAGLLDGVSAIVIGEPTGNALGLAAKGAIWLKADITGKTSHAAYPERGVNAISGAVRFASRVKELLTGSHPLLSPPSAEITAMEGGVKTNMVPDAATMTMDIRTVPQTDHPKLLASVLESARNMDDEGLKIKLEVLNERLPVTSPETSPIAVKLRDSYQSVFGCTPERTGTAFFSDASIFRKYSSADILLFGPGESGMAHTPNECVSLAAYENAVRVFRKLMENWQAD